jgi:hypothetical protein
MRRNDVEPNRKRLMRPIVVVRRRRVVSLRKNDGEPRLGRLEKRTLLKMRSAAARQPLIVGSRRGLA